MYGRSRSPPPSWRASGRLEPTKIRHGARPGQAATKRRTVPSAERACAARTRPPPPPLGRGNAAPRRRRRSLASSGTTLAVTFADSVDWPSTTGYGDLVRVEIRRRTSACCLMNTLTRAAQLGQEPCRAANAGRDGRRGGRRPEDGAKFVFFGALPRPGHRVDDRLPDLGGQRSAEDGLLWNSVLHGAGGASG